MYLDNREGNKQFSIEFPNVHRGSDYRLLLLTPEIEGKRNFCLLP